MFQHPMPPEAGMASLGLPRNPAISNSIQTSAGMASVTPSLPHATSVSSPHQQRGHGRPRARTFSVTKHSNVATVSTTALLLHRPSVSRPIKPQRVYQHHPPATNHQHTAPPANNLCCETPSRFASTGDNFLFSLLHPVSHPTAGHSAHTRPCENTSAHPTRPHHVCTSCSSTALANIRSTPPLSFPGRRQVRRWPFVLPLCNRCTSAALAYHPSLAGYDGCTCSWRLLGRWLCFGCRVEELEASKAMWEAEREARTGFTAPGVVDGKECVAWLGCVCRCGRVVEGSGVKAGRCAACEGVVHWGRGGSW